MQTSRPMIVGILVLGRKEAHNPDADCNEADNRRATEYPDSRQLHTLASNECSNPHGYSADRHAGNEQ